MPPKIVVAGPLAAKPGNAGGVWERLSFAEGLRRLGFDVVFVEQVSEPPSARALAWFDAAVAGFGFTRRAALLDEVGWTRGCDREQLRRIAADAVLLLNLGGNLTAADLLDAAPTTAFLDVDPGFTQLWHADHDVAYAVPRHDHYLTLGEQIGRPGCPIPTGGLPWKPVRQPVLLDEWPVMAAPACRRFTTIGSWRGPYGSVMLDGMLCGLKVHEFRRIVDLPARVDAAFEVALEIHPGDDRDRLALEAAGWRLAPPEQVAATPDTFRRYIQGSDAEFSVAQGVYVHGRSGWFSDRSTRYLASGKPVLVQETGLVDVPTGEGIVTFRSLDEAAEAARRIMADYPRHCRAARGLAEEFFASDVVLRRLLAAVGLEPPGIPA